MTGCMGTGKKGKIRITFSERQGGGLIVLLFVTFLINYQYVLSRDYSGFLGRALHYGIIAAIILVAARSDFKKNDPLVFIGDNSYTIYLIHPTILSLSFWLLSQWGYSFCWWMCAIAVVASLLAGIALGKVERGLNAEIKMLQAERRKPTPIEWKRCVAWLAAGALTLGCFACLKTFPEIQKSKREDYSSYAAVAFDYSNIERNGLNPGWVDSLVFKPAGDGTVTVSAEGWAYDSVTNAEVSQIAVLADGKSVPVSIAWFDRPGVGGALGTLVPISCGFTLKTEPIPIGVNLEFYASMESGSFLPLACSENTMTG